MSGNYVHKGKGWGVRHLMEESILNFYFDYLNPSLRKLLLAKCDSQEKQFASSMNPFISEHVFDICERET